MSIRSVLTITALAVAGLVLPTAAHATKSVNAKYAGIYKANNGFTTAKVSYAGKGKVAFAISNSVGMHVGDVEGKVTVRNGKGTFHNPENRAETLKLTFGRRGTMGVKQTGEFSGYAGLNVTFNGNFKRSSR